ncbi:hypothetical protein D9613_008885 [Agrocybe pediades]|uniref:Uncharacterized protein n=1 Tax=Agrocybe pediades TaxID=84607 RepID=A0A8H4QU60_9AGAR|nr:hypothetical protein D9613_008885 [Agrocybe pediades]
MVTFKHTTLLPFDGCDPPDESPLIHTVHWLDPTTLSIYTAILALSTSESDLVKASDVIEKLEWRKNGSGFRHEYLVATVICPNHQKALLRFERCGTRNQRIEEVHQILDENKRAEAESIGRP